MVLVAAAAAAAVVVIVIVVVVVVDVVRGIESVCFSHRLIGLPILFAFLHECSVIRNYLYEHDVLPAFLHVPQFIYKPLS
jgi:hypothetical protein